MPVRGSVSNCPLAAHLWRAIRGFYRKSLPPPVARVTTLIRLWACTVTNVQECVAFSGAGTEVSLGATALHVQKLCILAGA